MKTNINIPTISDLVSAGNPRMKVDDSTQNVTSQYDDLNARIDDLESAIGQDADGPIGRAFAIRAEKIG